MKTHSEASQEERRKRLLTDEDVQALALEIRKQMVGQFYKDLGSGVWGFIWKGIIIAAMGLAAYGAGKSHI